MGEVPDGNAGGYVREDVAEFLGTMDCRRVRRQEGTFKSSAVQWSFCAAFCTVGETLNVAT